MNIIGISAFYHESTCCLIQDGRLVAAVPEERFTRVKHDRRSPINAFRYCLQAGGHLGPGDIDCLAYYELPELKVARQRAMGLGEGDASRPERELRETLGYEGPFVSFAHHLSHAASAFYFSGFREAAVLTVDGVGEWATTTYGAGNGAELRLLDAVDFPDSLGLLYSTLTDFLGFQVLSDEYKVMGLAPYGEARFLSQLRRMVRSGEGGQYRLDSTYFDFSQSHRMYTDALSELLGIPRRVPESEILQVHKDVARSLQLVLEELLVEKVHYLHRLVGSENLCLAGGVALNCVANRQIHLKGPFKNLFVQPAAGDSGSALGAAALAHVQLTGTRHTEERLAHVFLGPSYTGAEIADLLLEAGIEAVDHRGDEAGLLASVAERLAAGQVVGWFHGRMEFGPRALGARSILADPRDPNMRDRLNALVKKREGFRPFAPAILEAHAAEHLDLDAPSRFMSETCGVRSRLELPAVTHVDGSARAQTVAHAQSPRFAALLERFYQVTGCPILVNTSFNVRGEPIVCTPEDALRCMANSQIDCLVLEDFVIDKASIPAFLRKAAASASGSAGVALGPLRDRVVTELHPLLAGHVERWRPAEGILPEGVYTFV